MWILVLAWLTAAQAPDWKAQFRRGVSLYREGRLREASATFERVAEGSGGKISRAAWVMRAKALLKMGRYGKARKVLEEFLSRYPESSYTAYAEYLLGHCSARLGEFSEAALHYRRASELTGKEELKDRAERMLEVLQARGLPPRIAVLGPFTGPDREFGDALRRGAELAYEMFAPEGATITYRDTGGDPIRTVKEVQALASQDEVIAIVGPIFASSAVPAAAVAQAEELPLIAPAVTEDGFASIGPYIFQLNLSPRLHGRRIGDAALKLGLRTFAVLASLDDYGRRMTQGFREAVEGGGGEVLDIEWYSPGTTDFSAACSRIRRAGWEVLKERWAEEIHALWTTFSSLVPDTIATPDTTLREVFCTWVSQDSSLGIPEGVVRAWVAGGDSTMDEWFSTYEDTARVPLPIPIDGLLVVGGVEDIVQIVPQVAFHRIRTRFLGGQAWNDPRVSLSVGRYAEGAVFSAVFFPDSPREEVRRFVEEYRRRYGREPGLVDALSYDATSLALEALERAGPNRESVRGALSEVKGYRGASGQVRFSEEGANGACYILELSEGHIRQLRWE